MAQALILSMLNEPAPQKTTMMPISRPTSPVRLVKNALRAASEFVLSSHQCPISMNEQRPMISQPRSSWIVFSATTSVSMPAVNRERKA